jgi:glutathione S-transferase
MIEVHHLNNSRSQRVLWLMEELQLPYKIVQHMRDPVTMLGPKSLMDIHPLGKSPVIRDGDLVLPESGAIIEFVTERYGKGRLAPKHDSADYARYLYWLHYAEGSIMFPVLLNFYANRFGGEAMAPIKGRAVEQLTLHYNFLEAELGKAPYFIGTDLTAADVAMSFPLEMAASLGVNTYPKIAEYLKRIHARPAYKAALEKGGAYNMAGVTQRPLPKA